MIRPNMRILPPVEQHEQNQYEPFDELDPLPWFIRPLIFLMVPLVGLLFWALMVIAVLEIGYWVLR